MSTMFSNYDIRGRLGETLTVEQVWNAGKAFAEWLPADGPVVVTHDDQVDPTVIKAVVEGLRLQGRDVLDGGSGDTANLVEALGMAENAGGIMVSGEATQQLSIIEFYDERAQRITTDTGLTDITALAESANFMPASDKGDIQSVNP